MLRLGAAVVVPALIAAGAYVTLREDPPPARTVNVNPDDDSSLTEPNPTGAPDTSSPSPSASPSAPSEQPRGSVSPTPSATETAPPDRPSESPSGTPDEPSTPSPSDEPTASPQPVPPAELTEAEAELWTEIKDARGDYRCPALKLNSQLITAARARSAAPDGPSAADRAAEAGFHGDVTENTAQGPTNASVAMALLRLDGMQTNIKNCEFDVVGVGRNDSGGAPWKVIFGES